MVNCKKYTQYLHKLEIKPLKWYEKVLMQFHYYTCKWCRKYTQENEWLNDYLKHKLSELQFFNDNEIEQYKQELLQKLKL